MKKYYLMMAAAAFLFAACEPKTPDTPDTPETPDEPEVTITIDGNFDDWGKLDQTKVAVAKNNPDSPWDAVKQMRVYAEDEFVYYYIEFDNSQIGELLAAAQGTYTNSHGEQSENVISMRINLNTDGEFTSGYENYSLQAYDFIIEGTLAQDAKWVSFDGTLHQRIGSWKELLKPGNSLVMGAGNGNKYEIMLVRSLFNNAVSASSDPKPMGDTFQTGLRFYSPGWEELSNLPNAAVTDDNSHGWGNLLEVTFNK